MGKRVAIYLRVSKDNGSQSTDNQRPDCEALARRHGELVEVYDEQASAVKRRPEYERMLGDARAKKFDVLVVWAIDRFGRSMAGNLADVTELDKLGVSLASVKESWLDTTGPVRDLLVAIFSWVAQQERSRLVERTKAGLDRARAAGKRIGPPRRLDIDMDMVQVAAARGTSYRAIARGLGVSESHMRALVRKAKGEAA